MGLLTTCIFGFGFSFMGGLLGGTLGDSFLSRVCENVFGPLSDKLMEGTDCAKLFVTHLKW